MARRRRCGDLVSVRNSNILLTVVCIVLSAAVCTFIAVDSGDRAVEQTKKSCDSSVTSTRATAESAVRDVSATGDISREDLSTTCDTAVTSCFGTCEDNTKYILVNLVGSLTQQVVAQMQAYSDRPWDIAVFLQNYLNHLHVSETHSMADTPEPDGQRQNGLYNLRLMMYSLFRAHIEILTGGEFITTRGQRLGYTEDPSTLKGDYPGYRRIMARWTDGVPASGVAALPNMIERQSCKEGIPCGRVADVALDGTWPETCACTNAAFAVDGGRTCMTTTAPILLDPSHNSTLASGACPYVYTSGGLHTRSSVYVAGTLILQPGEMRWSPPRPYGPFIGQGVAANWVPVGGFPAEWAQYSVGGRAGAFTVGVDCRAITQFLQAIDMGGTQTRIFITTRTDWIHATVGALGGDSAVGMLAGASHGVSWRYERRVQPGYEWLLPHDAAYRDEPLLLPDVAATDAVVASTAAWIRGSGDGTIESYAMAKARQDARGGHAERYNATRTDAGVNRTEPFYASLTHFDDGRGIDAWLVVAVDHESVLGAVDRANVATVRDIARGRADVNARVAESARAVEERVDAARAATDAETAASRQKVDDDVAHDQSVLAVIVAVVTLVLVFVSAAFVGKITAPLMALSKQMSDVACMNLDSVAIEPSVFFEVKKMQRSFVRMVANMKELRNYMPASLFDCDLDDAADDIDVVDAAALRDRHGSLGSFGAQSVHSHHTAGARSKRTARGGDGRAAAAARGRGTVAASSAASSQSAAVRAFLKKTQTSDGLRHKKATLMSCNVVGWHAWCKGDTCVLSDIHQNIFSSISHHVAAAKGVTDLFNGDRVSAGFGTVRPLGTHRRGPALVAAAICGEVRGTPTTEDPGGSVNWAKMTADAESSMGGSMKLGGSMRQVPRGELRMSCAAATGEVLCGNMGCQGLKKFMAVSPVATFAYALERFARGCDVRGCVVDKNIEEDIANIFYTRKLGMVTFAKRSSKPIPVYEQMERQAHSEEEWMYQLDQGKSSTPYAGWNTAVNFALNDDWAEANRVGIEAIQTLSQQRPGAPAVVTAMLSRILEVRTASTTIMFH